MAIIFNPALYQLSVYNKPLAALPVDIASKSLRHKSQVIPVTIDWISFPTFAVLLNINQGTTGMVLPVMQGVYIDNSQNLTELIFICEGTGYTFTVNQGEQRYVPLIMQQGALIRIYNGSQSNTLVGGGKPQINILFTDFFIPEFATAAFPRVITQDQISSTIVGGNVQQNFASSVLGDTYVSNDYSLSVSGNIGTLLPTQPLGGFYVITNMLVAVKNCYVTGAQVFLNTQVRYGAGPASQFTIGAPVNADDNLLGYVTLYNKDDIFLILDATQTLNIFSANAIPGGLINYTFDYAWVLLIN